MLEPKRVLLIRRKAIGDVLVSMPVAAALRKAWPNARLHLVVDRFAADVVRGSPYVDEIIVYDRERYSRGEPTQRMKSSLRWMRRLRRLRYDVVLDLMGTPQTALWTRVTGAPTRVGRARRFRTWAYNVVLPASDHAIRFAGDVFLDWVRAVGIDPGPWQPVPVVRPAEMDDDVAAVLQSQFPGDGPLVVLNPSATWSAKAWPHKHFAQLAQLLSDQMGARILVAWGPGEEAARDAVVSLSDGRARAMPRTDLITLAAYLRASNLLITTDSGPKHVAVAEGTPTLTLFGSTDPRGWQPPGSRHRWVTQDVPCRPCNLTECVIPGHPCLDDLRPERVLAEAERMLASTPPKAARS